MSTSVERPDSIGGNPSNGSSAVTVPNRSGTRRLMVPTVRQGPEADRKYRTAGTAVQMLTSRYVTAQLVQNGKAQKEPEMCKFRIRA